MKLAQLTFGLPPIKKIPHARSIIAQRLRDSNQQVVVVDDDPTGTQTVHGVRVYLGWSVETLESALECGTSASFISANTRALNADEAAKTAMQIGRNIRLASDAAGVTVLAASRSDSTLRGHFPIEVDFLSRGLGTDFDGIILAPAFFEAGRYTINDIHWVDQGDAVVPASETEFAKDPVFGYENSNLPLWVEEKTRGETRAEEVVSISIEDLRIGGAESAAEKLLSVHNGVPVVANAACYEDLEIFILGLTEAEASGKRFIYRTAAPFVKVRAGIPDRPLLTAQEIGVESVQGLVVAGSYVGKTTRQLDALMESGLAVGTEMDVSAVLNPRSRDAEISKKLAAVENSLKSGKTAVLYTSREVITDGGGAQFLHTGKAIMDALCEIVRGISVKPGFVLAKGGITSMEVARIGLGVTGAQVLGQILPGVPVWRLGSETKWPGTAYIVFPGNVGDDLAVLNAVRALVS